MYIYKEGLKTILPKSDIVNLFSLQIYIFIMGRKSGLTLSGKKNIENKNKCIRLWSIWFAISGYWSCVLSMIKGPWPMPSSGTAISSNWISSKDGICAHSKFWQFRVNCFLPSFYFQSNIARIKLVFSIYTSALRR